MKPKKDARKKRDTKLAGYGIDVKKLDKKLASEEFKKKLADEEARIALDNFFRQTIGIRSIIGG